MGNIYTPAEIAEILKVKPRTIQEYIRAGKIAAVKIGREYRITESGLNDFLKQLDTDAAKAQQKKATKQKTATPPPADEAAPNTPPSVSLKQDLITIYGIEKEHAAHIAQAIPNEALNAAIWKADGDNVTYAALNKNIIKYLTETNASADLIATIKGYIEAAQTAAENEEIDLWGEPENPLPPISFKSQPLINNTEAAAPAEPQKQKPKPQKTQK